MQITPTQLRKDLYHLLDQVDKTGKPLKIKRKGRALEIVVSSSPVSRSKLDNLKKRKVMNCDPEELVHMDWSGEINLDFP